MAETLSTQLAVLAEQLRASIVNQEEIKESLNEIKDTIFKGDAKSNSILVRLVELERSSNDYLKRMTAMEQSYLELQKEDKRGRWKLIAIMTVSIIGWFGIIMTDIAHKAGWFNFIVQMMRGSI